MEPVSLPPPRRDGRTSVEASLDRRRTCRDLAGEPLDDASLGQLLWAAQGTNAHGSRTSPSAGGLYPLEIYAVTAAGYAHYDPRRHCLRRLSARDARAALSQAALGQSFVASAPLTIVLCAVFARVTGKYGPARGQRYVLFEVGHAGQNILLQAEALGLGAVPVGAFEDRAVRTLLDLPSDHEPLYLISIGHPLTS